MTSFDIAKKNLILSDIRAWRKAVAGSNSNVVVVAGSFDIFQPGNLMAMRTAAGLASSVCVVVDADEHRQSRIWTWNSAEVRTESVAHLQAATVVLRLTTDQAETGLRDLQPYRLVDCMARPARTSLHKAVRALAGSVNDLPPIPDCFTQDISNRILRNNTPVPVAAGVEVPIFNPAELDQFRLNHKGRRLVTVNGCFDILHLGHLRMLAQARQMGDELIVLTNDDASVRAYKGPTRPVFPINFRLTALNALESVTRAYPFAGNNPLELLAQIRPDIHVKGGTYEDERVKQERELLASWGGRLEFCPMVEGFSTTSMINRTGK